MEVENKFMVEVTEDNMVHVIQTIVKKMKIGESMIEYNKMQQEHTQIQAQLEKMQKYIDDEEAEKSLKSLQDNDSTISKLQEEWTKKTADAMNNYSKEVKSAVEKEKIKRGFAREQEENKKAVLRANILGQVANEYNLDINHPIIQKLRQEFEKI